MDVAYRISKSKACAINIYITAFAQILMLKRKEFYCSTADLSKCCIMIGLSSIEHGDAEKVEAVVPRGITPKVIDSSGKLP